MEGTGGVNPQLQRVFHQIQDPMIPQGDPLLTEDTTQLKAAALEAHMSNPEDHQVLWPPDTSWRSVEVQQAQNLSYAMFLQQYMAPNRPVLIKGAMGSWRAVREWVDSDGGPNVQALLSAVGHTAPVSVTDTSQQQSGSGTCVETTLGQYVQWWSSRGVQPGQEEQSTPGSSTLPPGHWYLKDWHFVAAAGPDYQAYHVPEYFRSDWLNEHYDGLSIRDSGRPTTHTAAALSTAGDDGGQQEAGQGGGASHGGGGDAQGAEVTCADYRFVYLGPAGSWTPLHSDVLRSYSWSANIAGKKLWLLLPPEYTYLAYDLHMTRLAPEWGLPHTSYAHPAFPGYPPVQQPLHEDPHLAAQFPNLHKARQQLYYVVQEPGEMLFVPSGWHHTVLNLTDTLSINHNWLNACNIHWCWHLVRATHSRAQASIADCRELCSTGSEWWELVQRMVKADCGLNLQGLAHLCADIMAHALCHVNAIHGSILTAQADASEQAAHNWDGHELDADVMQQLLDLKRAAAVLSEVVTAMMGMLSDVDHDQSTAGGTTSDSCELAAHVGSSDSLQGCVGSCHKLLDMAKHLIS